MSEVQPRDILVRVGGRTLQRFGVLAVAGSSRGPRELVETFTRAGHVRRFRDKDGVGRKAAAGNIAIEYPSALSGLTDAFGYDYMGPLLEGARIQLVTEPENFGAWGVAGTPVLTSGQADPFGGTAAYLIEDNDAAAFEHLTSPGDLAFTDGERSAALFIKQGSASTSWARIRGGATDRHRIVITWTNGVPALSTGAGAGTLFPVEKWAGGWYRIAFSATGVLAADTNVLEFGPGTFATSGTGTGYFFGANAWDAPFPSSYQGPGDGTAAADVLSVPLTVGPQDLTILARVARPAHVDTASVTAFCHIAALGWLDNSTPSLFLNFENDERQVQLILNTPTTDAEVFDVAIPAGAEIAACVQLRDPTSGGMVRMDVGSGFSSEAGPATAFSAWGAQVLRIGGLNQAGTELYGVLLDVIVARGLFTRAEMLAVE